MYQVQLSLKILLVVNIKKKRFKVILPIKSQLIKLYRPDKNILNQIFLYALLKLKLNLIFIMLQLHKTLSNLVLKLQKHLKYHSNTFSTNIEINLEVCIDQVISISLFYNQKNQITFLKDKENILPMIRQN